MQKKYYGRIKSRPLSISQRSLIDDTLPEYNFSQALALDKTKHLEIGFGMGDFLIEKALQNPDDVFIGVEPFLNGIVSVLRKIPDNVFIFKGVVDDLFELIPDNIFSHVYILYPDPWPKKRHHKRRLIQTAFLDALCKKMKSGAKLFISTDHPDYQAWILEKTKNLQLVEKYYGPRMGTKYERKALEENRICMHLEFQIGM